MSTTPRRLELSTTRHDSDASGLRYVYAVLSRRAGGVSIGVNLSTTHACNWRCVYCQVPELARGASPVADLDALDEELRSVLDALDRGELFARPTPDAPAPRAVDVAFAGDGEPTTCPNFADAVDRVGAVLSSRGLSLPIVVISNGSRVEDPRAQEGLRRLAALGGRVWFKLDRATREGIYAVNQSAVSPERHLARLRTCAALCPTWVQSCFFARGGAAPSSDELDAWVGALATLAGEGVAIRGVQLYSLARPSHQPEAAELSAVDRPWLEALAARVRAIGFEATVSG